LCGGLAAATERIQGILAAPTINARQIDPSDVWIELLAKWLEFQGPSRHVLASVAKVPLVVVGAIGRAGSVKLGQGARTMTIVVVVIDGPPRAVVEANGRATSD
jgi:hypothetical protein